MAIYYWLQLSGELERNPELLGDDAAAEAVIDAVAGYLGPDETRVDDRVLWSAMAAAGCRLVEVAARRPPRNTPMSGTLTVQHAGGQSRLVCALTWDGDRCRAEPATLTGPGGLRGLVGWAASAAVAWRELERAGRGLPAPGDPVLVRRAGQPGELRGRVVRRVRHAAPPRLVVELAEDAQQTFLLSDVRLDPLRHLAGVEVEAWFCPVRTSHRVRWVAGVPGCVDCGGADEQRKILKTRTEDGALIERHYSAPADGGRVRLVRTRKRLDGGDWFTLSAGECEVCVGLADEGDPLRCGPGELGEVITRHRRIERGQR